MHHFKKLTNDMGLKLIDGEYKNRASILFYENQEGYILRIVPKEFLKTPPYAPFSKSNPYTIYNIKLFLSVNNPNIILLSTEYKGKSEPLLCKCLIDGHEWSCRWDNLQAGKGCPVCGGSLRLTIEYVKEKIKEINENIEIIDTSYTNAFKPLLCKCMIDNHTWSPCWNSLQRNQGCPECAIKKAKEVSMGVFNNTLAERNKCDWIEIPAIVYIINLYNESENFYKIGITTKDANGRFKNSKTGYNHKTIKEIKTNLYDGVYLESKLHLMHEEYHYVPSNKFDGYTECFSKIINL